jgi:hypothetical protein
MTEISTITGKPFATFDEKMKMTRGIFNAIRDTIRMPDAAVEMATGQRTFSDIPREFIDRSDPNYQESIISGKRPFTETHGIDEGDFMLPGQSGAWKGPLSSYLKHVRKNPGSSLKNIVKDTDLSEYQVKTLRSLFKKNATDLEKLPLNEEMVYAGVVHPDLNSKYASDLPNMAAHYSEQMQAIGAPNPGKMGQGVVRVFKKSDAIQRGTQNEFRLKPGAKPIKTITPWEARGLVK